MMAETNTKDYDTYPVHDHCDEDGAPFAGCVDVDVLYYSVSVPLSSTYSLAIAEDDQAPFIDELISGSYNELIMNTTLDCSDAYVLRLLLSSLASLAPTNALNWAESTLPKPACARLRSISLTPASVSLLMMLITSRPIFLPPCL